MVNDKVKNQQNITKIGRCFPCYSRKMFNSFDVRRKIAAGKWKPLLKSCKIGLTSVSDVKKL